MRQPIITKQHIIERAGSLFNTYGYKATSISDITTATGLTKGAIYRHFVDKADLEAAALSYLANIVFEKMRLLIKAEERADMKLKAILTFFASYVTNTTIPGGCPLLNVATEIDDKDVVLRVHARSMLDMLRSSIITIIENGKRFDQIQGDTNADMFSSIFIASLEGGVMMSKLSNAQKDIDYVIAHLDTMIGQITKE
jgi:TetR/AcrR family transcriptional regulator, transcriptional repressor for nem operon